MAQGPAFRHSTQIFSIVEGFGKLKASLLYPFQIWNGLFGMIVLLEHPAGGEVSFLVITLSVHGNVKVISLWTVMLIFQQFPVYDSPKPRWVMITICKFLTTTVTPTPTFSHVFD